MILTAGCAKYRYNKLGLGNIGNIPRVLDAGQCNDSYSLVRIALKLQEVFGLKDINELPIVYNIAWYCLLYTSTRCKRNMAGRPSGRSTHPSPDRQPLSARKAETEVLNLPKSALLLWRTFVLVRLPYDYLNLKLSTSLAEQKEQSN